MNIHCINDVTDLVLEFVADKYPKSKITREKFILELLWSIENHKYDLYVEMFSNLLLGEFEHQEFMFLLMCREHVISVLKKIYAGKSG